MSLEQIERLAKAPFRGTPILASDMQSARAHPQLAGNAC